MLALSTGRSETENWGTSRSDSDLRNVFAVAEGTAATIPVSGTVANAMTMRFDDVSTAPVKPEAAPSSSKDCCESQSAVIAQVSNTRASRARYLRLRLDSSSHRSQYGERPALTPKCDCRNSMNSFAFAVARPCIRTA